MGRPTVSSCPQFFVSRDRWPVWLAGTGDPSRTNDMPKMKSKGSVKGRFRVTKSGKVKCSKPGRGHMHAIHNGKQKRELRRSIVLDGTWARLIRKMMGA